MLQGPGIANIEDIDQDTYALCAKLDVMEKHIFDAKPDAPMSAIMFYTLTIDKWRDREYYSTLSEVDKNAV